MVGSKGKGSGEGGQKRRAHASRSAARSASYAPRARSVGAQRRASCTCACVRAGNGAGTAHTPNTRSPTRSGGAHMRALARRGCWDRVTAGRVGGLQENMFICGEVRFLHISGVIWFLGYCLFMPTERAPHPEAVVFKGLHAVCFPGHGEGQYNNVMHS